jgi:CubicO group peptidase (beta-lactamase class C family)
MQLEDVLQDLISNVRSCLGAQASVAVAGGPRIELSCGDAGTGAMTVDTLHSVWCLTKPVVAMAACSAVEAAGLGPDSTLVEIGVVDDTGDLADISLGDVLCHDAGLGQPHAARTRISVSEDERLRGLAGAVQRASIDAGGKAAYSECSSWYLLGRMLERSARLRPEAYLQGLLDQAGLDIHFDIRQRRFDRIQHRIGCYFSEDGDAGFRPMLHDAVRSVACDARVHLGGYASMSGIRRWYEMLEERRGHRHNSGSHVPGGLLPTRSFLEKCLRRERRGSFDTILNRQCDFAAGFMTNLGGHHFGSRPSDAAIGHTGWAGATWSWSDPRFGITGAVLVNGIRFDDSMWTVLRPRVVDACYDLLDGHIDSAASAQAGAGDQTEECRPLLHHYVVDVATAATKLSTRVPGASIHVLWSITDMDDPDDVGACFLTEFTDGILTASRTATPRTPCDVIIEAPSALVYRLVRAELHVLELIAGGRCQGTITGMSIFTGIVEDESWWRAVHETDLDQESRRAQR